jgi:hypothetical protein
LSIQRPRPSIKIRTPAAITTPAQGPPPILPCAAIA